MRTLPFEYATRNLGRAPLRAIGGVLGAALVVLLVLTASAFVRGMGRSMTVSANSRNVILLGAGSEESLERSEIRANAPTLAAASIRGIRERLGVQYVSPEVNMALLLRESGAEARELNAVLRGVTPAAFLVHPQVQIVEGRAPNPGEYEFIVGPLAAVRMGVPEERLSVGRTLWFDNREWKIVGRFVAPQTVMEAELWAPLSVLMAATRRTTLSCVVLTLDDDGRFEDAEVFCAQRLDLELVAVRESDYFAGLLAFYGPVRGLIWLTTGLIALGGFLGGLNTLYAAFAARVRELGTLQTLGFSRTAISLSFLQESLLTASAGGIIACAAALLLIDGLAVRISMGAFALHVDAPVLLCGMLAGAGMAVVGVVPPLWRCLRLPIVEALRAA
ncbi:MAG: ABC transporter permease [Phycisphaerae bacterium]|jgi:putative ABC transport system permease protein|nr:ABC transporter permease [Phycisphaerae bacterium]MCZ2399474.1 ABC transporter permease [Phycisphaerae bacterium]